MLRDGATILDIKWPSWIVFYSRLYRARIGTSNAECQDAIRQEVKATEAAAAHGALAASQEQTSSLRLVNKTPHYYTAD